MAPPMLVTIRLFRFTQKALFWARSERKGRALFCNNGCQYTHQNTHMTCHFLRFCPPESHALLSSVFSQEGSRGQICMHMFWESLYDNRVCVRSTHLNTHSFLAPKTVINGFFKTRFDFCLLILEITHFKQCFAAVPLRFRPLLWLDEHYKVPYFTLLFITMGWSSYCIIV